MSEMCNSLLTSRNVYTDKYTQYSDACVCIGMAGTRRGMGHSQLQLPRDHCHRVCTSVCLSVFFIFVRCVLGFHFNSACALQNYIRLVYSAVPFVWLGGYAHWSTHWTPQHQCPVW